MNRITRDKVVYAMSPNNLPVQTVEEGAVVTFETCDCFENQITSANTPFQALDWDRINPATGPVFVKGAEPGDCLKVEIQSIKVRDYGVMLAGPGLGVIGDSLEENQIKIIPIKEGKAVFSEELQLPLNPMIGVIGTAPAEVDVPCGTPGDHGGNMDSKVIREGATLYLPVNVSGGLLALGDLHAAMGDGEVSVCGVEVAGEVTVKVSVIKNCTWPLPIVANENYLYTIASAPSLDQAGERATRNMVRFLEKECKMSKSEAINLLSITGNLQVSQVVDPLKTARMEIPVYVLEKLGFQAK